MLSYAQEDSCYTTAGLNNCWYNKEITAQRLLCYITQNHVTPTPAVRQLT
jgi:hypothetical protein